MFTDKKSDDGDGTPFNPREATLLDQAIDHSDEHSLHEGAVEYKEELKALGHKIADVADRSKIDDKLLPQNLHLLKPVTEDAASDQDGEGEPDDDDEMDSESGTSYHLYPSFF